MKFVRTILAVVVGIITAAITVGVVQKIGHVIYPPPEGVDTNDVEALREIIAQMPTGALAAVLIAWEVGALVGGAVAALIAGRGRCIHAGVIGGFILTCSIIMMFMLPHPNWMIVLGLLLPIPISLLAGKLVSMCMSPAPPQPPLAA